MLLFLLYFPFVFFSVASSSSIRMNNGKDDVEDFDMREFENGISGSEIETKLGRTIY